MIMKIKPKDIMWGEIINKSLLSLSTMAAVNLIIRSTKADVIVSAFYNYIVFIPLGTKGNLHR